MQRHEPNETVQNPSIPSSDNVSLLTSKDCSAAASDPATAIEMYRSRIEGSLRKSVEGIVEAGRSLTGGQGRAGHQLHRLSR